MKSATQRKSYSSTKARLKKSNCNYKKTLVLLVAVLLIVLPPLRIIRAATNAAHFARRWKKER
ncbi:MAG: hypothetical protein M3040_07650, partial [Bacteroidota bacterium]|nr:hypothetical protein [Bacteroidota bacterium]